MTESRYENFNEPTLSQYSKDCVTGHKLYEDSEHVLTGGTPKDRTLIDVEDLTYADLILLEEKVQAAKVERKCANLEAVSTMFPGKQNDARSVDDRQEEIMDEMKFFSGVNQLERNIPLAPTLPRLELEDTCED